MNLNWKDSVVHNFDTNAVTYDQNCDVQKTVAGRLAADLTVSNVSDILEIGCGTGNLTQHLLCKFPNRNFCITDISPSMVSKTKIKFQDDYIKWDIFDGENPDTSKRYDLIVSNLVFQWFENIEESLDKLCKILKPGGTIFYSTLGSESFKEWTSTLNELQLPVGIIDFHTPADTYKQEKIVRNYANAVDFLGSLKKIGAGQSRKKYYPLPPKQIKQACSNFDKSHGGKITWHIIYGRRQALTFKQEK